MNRSLSLVLAAALAAAVVPALAQPAQAATTACKIQPYGLIGARWQQLGGEKGKLGCPTTGERDILMNGIGWAGRRQSFQYGQIAWSPKLGGKFVVASWQQNGRSYVDWGRTDRAFDKFLVRYTSPSASQGVQRDVFGGFRGRYSVRVNTNGAYRWIVKGCDNGLFGSSCQKYWSISVSS
jgi:uncharacterized protein with LGFP repeats